MVPYVMPDNIRNNVFVKKIDGTYEPLKISGETYILETMSKEDFSKGVQPYNQEGKKMESDKLFNGGGSKIKRRRTRKKKLSKKKKRSTFRSRK